MAPPVIQQQRQKVLQDEEKAQVTPETQRRLLGSKARVEYRDQQGNVLDPKLVASLQKEGKVSLETRYETRSRLANGHEVDIVDGKIAPPHPDVEGQNPNTFGNKDADEKSPASVAWDDKSVEKKGSYEPKPASDGNEATQV